MSGHPQERTFSELAEGQQKTSCIARQPLLSSATDKTGGFVEGTVQQQTAVFWSSLPRCGRAHGNLSSSSPDRAHPSHVYLDHPFEALVIGIKPRRPTP
jgi:hypothetical protein